MHLRFVCPWASILGVVLSLSVFHFHPTKSQRVQFQGEREKRVTPFGPSALPSSSSFSYVAAADAAAGGLISPGKGQKDGGKGNERRKVGRIIHVDDEEDEEDEDADEGEGEDG